MQALKYMTLDWMVSERARLNVRLNNLRKLALSGYNVDASLEQVTRDLDTLQQEIDKRAERIHS